MPNLTEMFGFSRLFESIQWARNLALAEQSNINELRIFIEFQETSVDLVLRQLQMNNFSYPESEAWDKSMNKLTQRLKGIPLLEQELVKTINSRVRRLRNRLLSTNLWLGDVGATIDSESLATYTYYMQRETDLLTQDETRCANLADIFRQYKTVILQIKSLLT